MGQKRRPEVRACDLQGFKYFRLLMPLLERLKDVGTQRDRAGNRGQCGRGRGAANALRSPAGCLSACSHHAFMPSRLSLLLPRAAGGAWPVPL